ncbi:MAG: RidA family protein [bacterium]|nr:RidA family protein [bacterium]
MSRQNVLTGSPYEDSIGFSRAARVGNFIAVSGTAPIAPDGSTAAPGDLYKQTLRSLEIIESVIEKAGGKRSDVIRTRLFLTDIKRWEEAARAHGEFFSSIKPACSFVEVKGLIREDWLVEIEADCAISE